MAWRRKAARDDRGARSNDLISELCKRGRVEPLAGPLPLVEWTEEHDPGEDAAVVITADLARYLLNVVRMDPDFLAEHVQGPEMSWCTYGRGLEEPICGAPAASLDEAKSRAEVTWPVLVGAVPNA